MLPGGMRPMVLGLLMAVIGLAHSDTVAVPCDDKIANERCNGHGLCTKYTQTNSRGQTIASFASCNCFQPYTGRYCHKCNLGYSGPNCMSNRQQSNMDYQTDFPLEESWLMIVILISGIVFCLIHATMEGIYRRRAREQAVVDGAGSEIEAGYRPVFDEDMGSDPSSGDEETGLLDASTHPTAARITPPRPLLDEGVVDDGAKEEAGDGEGSARSLLTDDEEDRGKCKICFEEPINSVLLDCGHSCACFECAKRLIICPFCRRKIKKVKKIFLMM